MNIQIQIKYPHMEHVCFIRPMSVCIVFGSPRQVHNWKQINRINRFYSQQSRKELRKCWIEKKRCTQHSTSMNEIRLFRTLLSNEWHNYWATYLMFNHLTKLNVKWGIWFFSSSLHRLPCLVSAKFSSAYNHTVWRSAHSKILPLFMHSFRCCCMKLFKRSLFFSLRKVIIFPLHFFLWENEKWTAQLNERQLFLFRI